MDLNRISEILRMLQPRQEKVIRLYFGLGCQRSHSALEIAEAFEVSSQVIAGILGTAERRLARFGLTPIQLRAAARREAELHVPPGATYAVESNLMEKPEGPHLPLAANPESDLVTIPIKPFEILTLQVFYPARAVAAN